MAKPIAVDVPGVQTIAASAKKATTKNLCFLVDYQLPSDAANQEIARRIDEGGLGQLAHIYSGGTGGPWKDPKPEATIENLLHQGWLSRINLGGDDIVSYDIHIVDGVTWVMKKNPVSACGVSGVARQRNGDSTDCGGVVLQYEDGVIWTHITQALRNNSWILNLSADFMGVSATAHIGYWGKVHVRGGTKHYSGIVSESIYNDGIKANVAEFYRCITQDDFSNPTAKRAVDGTITSILGREAMARKCFLTRDELIRENKKLNVNLKGLKA
jgi:predicted dehydrogenase